MPKIKSLEELHQLRQQLQQDLKTRMEAKATVTVGMGTCGIAAGAREVMQAILDHLARHKLDVHVTTVGCIGMCSKEPLVDVQVGDGPRVTYGNVTSAMVPRIVQEHLLNQRVVDEWVVARAVS